MNTTDVVAQVKCYSSISSWLIEEQAYNRTRVFPLTTIQTALTRTESSYWGNGSAPIDCDGITRYQDDGDTIRNFTLTDGLEYNSTWSGLLTTTIYQENVPPYAQISPKPSCYIGEKVCNRVLKESNDNFDFFWRDSGDVKWEMPTLYDQYNCEPEEDPEPDSCYITLEGAVDVLFWPEQIESRDLCANDYFGTQGLVTAPKTSRVATLTNVMYTREWFGQRKSDHMFSHYFVDEFTGTWTLTSPSVYIVHPVMYATAGGSYVGSFYGGGIFAVHPSQLSSVVWTCRNIQDGTQRDFVEANIRREPAGNFPKCDLVPVTRSFNLIDLYAGVPAAAW